MAANVTRCTRLEEVVLCVHVLCVKGSSSDRFPHIWWQRWDLRYLKTAQEDPSRVEEEEPKDIDRLQTVFFEFCV